jgi:hypothetical protein
VAKEYEARQKKKAHLKKEELEKAEAAERAEVEKAAKAHQGPQHVTTGGGHSAPLRKGDDGQPLLSDLGSAASTVAGGVSKAASAVAGGVSPADSAIDSGIISNLNTVGGLF